MQRHKTVVPWIGEAPARALIVDDIERNLKLMEAYLSQEGVLMDFARDGLEALEKVETFLPDIILLDVSMPKMDGFEVCKRVKNNPATFFVPIIMVTALEQSERIRGLEAGADDFLTKPVNRNELLVRFRGLLKLKKMHDKVVHYEEALESLFELSTFSERYNKLDEVLRALCERVSVLLGIGSVMVLLEDGGSFRVVGGVGIPPQFENRIFEPNDEKIGDVLRNGKTTVALSAFSGSKPGAAGDLGAAAVPLRSYENKIIGALMAVGDVSKVDEGTMHILTILGFRIASEIQIQNYSLHLEKEVASRTDNLRKTFRELSRANSELIETQEEMIFRLSVAAEFRDENTSEHLKRISGYSSVIAKAMGMSDQFVRQIGIASLMHDLGKIGIPDAILLKKGQLTNEEFKLMKQHTLIGAKILSGSTSELLMLSEKVALSHHERFDGKGYPYGLIGEDIPLEGRIVAITDVFDAITTARPYKPAIKVERALEMIRAERGKHFDPVVADAFFERLGEILAMRAKYREENETYF